MKMFTEKLYPEYMQRFKIKNIIVKENSPYQKILIFDNKKFGRVLALDNVIQITEKDHHAYSEMLVHFPIISNKKIKKILIIGGGDGAIAAEILKHNKIKEIVVCEIDKRVIELSKKYLHKINSKSLLDPKINIIIEDAAKFITSPRIRNYFDLVITDRPDPIGPGKKLFNYNFYNNIKNIISNNGVAVFQNGVPFFQKKELKDTFKKLKNVFQLYGVYLTVVPSYVGGHMVITWASDYINLNKKINIKKNIFRKTNLVTKYYSPEIHNASLALPNWIKSLKNFS